ncbi:MAG: DUF4124 domain-containing protein [Deltaproteobacteria bacterium]|nr:DUF4124 domain-containing protein [Deltaproteobacteria bacterium]
MAGMRWIGVVIVAGGILARPEGGIAQIYRWVDARGTVHFTDRLAGVPSRVEAQVRYLPEGPILRGIPPTEVPRPQVPPPAPLAPRAAALVRAGEPPARVPEEIRARLAAELGVDPDEIVSVSPGLGRVELSGGRSRLLPRILEERPFLKEELEHPFLHGLSARRFLYPGASGVIPYPGYYPGPAGFLSPAVPGTLQSPAARGPVVPATARPSGASSPATPATLRSSAGATPTVTPRLSPAARRR